MKTHIRQSLWSFLCVLVGVAVGAFLPHPVAAPPPESTDEILARLGEAGLEYEGKWLGPEDGAALHGFHLKPLGDPRTWEHLGSRSVHNSARHVVLVHAVPHLHGVSGRVSLSDRYDLIGDPEEIRKILEALR
jgi:hypothetical protein